MKPVLSRAQMRAYDKFAVETCHVPGVVLMENAGRGAADVIGRIADRSSARIVVICGAGNNGGDGFAVARHLLSRGFDVHCFLMAPSEKVTGDARINHDAYIDVGGHYTELPPGKELGPLEDELSRATLTVDALFGTGLARPIEGHLKDVIEVINQFDTHRVALDIPSGLDADTGTPLGLAVHAHDTVTFGCLKMGLLTPEGARLAGNVHVVDLGVPEMVLAHVGHVAEVIERDTVASWIPRRETNVHKHAAGSVLCVAGSRGKVGAALLVGRGALRAGAGLVTLASWPEAVDALESRVVELMSARIDRADVVGSLDRALVGKRVVAIGPGLGLDDVAKTAIEHILFGWHGLKVVDADALTLFAGRPEALAAARGPMILTPHPGEAARLLGRKSDEVERNRAVSVRELAERTGAIVVLKGARTIIASRSGPLYINTSGNPALATAGAGDVLAGIIAAFACGIRLDHAACAGVHVHGLAADAWRAKHEGADRGLLASEIADEVPAVLAALSRRAVPPPV
jgi:ADP-dependent NAD(P)H-hydrate dehydratase / NAD(P)H-hydrate epimerase